VLYTEHSTGAGFDGANLMVAPLDGGAAKVVLHGGYYGRYASSGHLIYMQQGTLFALPFDLDRLQPIGAAVPALDALSANSDRGGAQVALSSDGTLIYLPGTAITTAQRPIDWLTRDDKTSVLRATRANWTSPRFSPDGQRLALDILTDKQRDIWLYDWARDTLTQLTFDPSYEQAPVWTPDGRHIVFASDRAKAGVANLYETNADGTGKIVRLTESSEIQGPGSWHPSGKFLAFDARRGATGLDLMILPMEGDAAGGGTPGKATVFLSTPAYEAGPMFSPDGKWIAYTSNEASGHNDVYVRPFPGPGGKWRISTEGGGFPRWSATTRELLFVDPAQHKVMVASYAVVGDSFRADKPQLWSRVGQHDLSGNYAYDVHPDGKRLAMTTVREQSAVVLDKVVFVFNFFDYLRKIGPVAK
jgi:serine/threonine-protein kinase